MEKYIINGQKKLSGQIRVSGAKNQALKVLPATLLSDGITKLNNVPEIEDVHRMIELMTDIGVKVTKLGQGQYEIDPSGLNKTDLSEKLVRQIRSAIMLVGPLLAKKGKVSMAHPGGCIIGKRPIDLFIYGFEKLGAKYTENESSYEFSAKSLKGAEIIIPIISVTVTENLMLAATLATGTTVIKNAACEPEIPTLADYLNSCGAKISGAGTSTITIEGVKTLKGGEFTIIPDRIETGTFVMLGLITQSEITITNCEPKHLEIPLFILQKAGAKLEIGPDYIKTFPSKITGNSLATHEYPGFPTDLQAPYTVLMTQATGTSLIHETIFEGRLLYTDILNQMGANITMCDPHRVVVSGPTQLFGRKVASPDLRAGITLVLAALVAQGTTTIDNIYQINRGYENIVERIKNLGADIQQIAV